MREILFRGKRIDNGEMVEGNYIHRTLYYGLQDDTHFIVENGEFDYDYYTEYQVVSDTLGQYTGLTDKNGKRIFEGDLITIPGSKRQGLPAPVKWSNFDARFEICRRGFNPICLDGDEGIYEVIGNIHDNYEFLEGE